MGVFWSKMAAGWTLDCYRMETQWVDRLLDPELTETPAGKKQLLQNIFQHEHRLAVNMIKKSFSVWPVYKPARSCSCVFVHSPVCIDPPLILRERRPLRR